MTRILGFILVFGVIGGGATLLVALFDLHLHVFFEAPLMMLTMIVMVFFGAYGLFLALVGEDGL